MGIRTAEEYRKGLQDGRKVYFNGKLVTNLIEHELLSLGISHVAETYDAQFDPELRDLATVPGPDGEMIGRFYHIPTSVEDLLRKAELIEKLTERGLGIENTVIRFIGADALNALNQVTAAIDRETGSEYLPRVKRFREHCQKNDLAVVLAQSDTKGDRSKGPLDQADPDLYLRIVRRTPEGIVVRGAKTSVTGAPLADEIIVIPTKTIKESEADYAVAFACPVNAPGVVQIATTHGDRPLSSREYPISSKHLTFEGTIFFNDVFIPWERVFMAGEYRFSWNLLLAFDTFLRWSGLAIKPVYSSLLVGMAQLILEANGLDKATLLRDKLGEIMIYRETIRALCYSAAAQCSFKDGVAVPNSLIASVAKFYYATNHHRIEALVQDIAGAGVVTSPSLHDFDNPETRPLVEKYFAGREGISTEDRLKLFKLIRDVAASEFGGYHGVTTLHGDGSIAAQKLTIAREFDLQACREMAARAAGIKLGES